MFAASSFSELLAAPSLSAANHHRSARRRSPHPGGRSQSQAPTRRRALAIPRSPAIKWDTVPLLFTPISLKTNTAPTNQVGHFFDHPIRIVVPSEHPEPVESLAAIPSSPVTWDFYSTMKKSRNRRSDQDRRPERPTGAEGPLVDGGFYSTMKISRKYI